MQGCQVWQVGWAQQEVWKEVFLSDLWASSDTPIHTYSNILVRFQVEFQSLDPMEELCVTVCQAEQMGLQHRGLWVHY